MTNGAPVAIDAEEEQDDLETQLNKIADQLAELSTAEECPTGFRQQVSFEATDVDFTSNGWLIRVMQVYGWLHPDGDIDIRSAEANPLLAARKLFDGLNSESPATCVEEFDGAVRLCPSGAELLGGRLDTAISLQAEFLEALENGSKRQATVQWDDAWEEDLDVEDPDLEPINAKSETWGINDFSDRASLNQLSLNPSYQRGDVWPTSDSQKLIESILRGIPLPSIILLKPKTRGHAIAKYEVVDGKQRLTSILRFVGKHPAAIERVREASGQHLDLNLMEHFKNDYRKFRRLWKRANGETLTDKKEAEYYFPFRLKQKSLRGELEPLNGKYYCEIKEAPIHVASSYVPVSVVFELSSGYKIPLIVYEDASARQIHDVFHLYNKQGKHLNAEEIRNALFHEVDLVRLVLLASGDNPNPELAQYIPEGEVPLLRNIARYLSQYRFGSLRYRKTKLLSWVYALLFHPLEVDGELKIRSTAAHINALFRELKDAPQHHLLRHENLRQLITDTDRCLDLHTGADDCWHPRFKDNDQGHKWQELQLVATIIAVFLIRVVEDNVQDVLDSHMEAISEFTRTHLRPEKSQNKTQWGFIGTVALGILRTVGIDETQLDSALVSRYGTSCLGTLRATAAAGYYEPRAV